MLRNFQKLLSVNIITGILGLVSLTIVSRGLGPEMYGYVAVIISLGAFIEQLASFQAWQAITKYASEARVKQEGAKFWQIVSLGLAIDIFGSAMASLLGVGIVLLFSDLVGISGEALTLALFYMLSLTFNISGTATAVMRIFDQYTEISLVLLAASLLKLAGIVLLWFLGMSLSAIIFLFISVQVFQSLANLLLMLRICQEQEEKISLRKLRFKNLREYPGFLRFVISTNISSTIRLIMHEFDILLLSSMAGTTAAGQYKLAKQFGAVVLRLADPAQQVAFPKISALVGENDFISLGGLVRKLATLGLMAAIFMEVGFWAFGEPIIVGLLGEEYLPVVSYLAIYIHAITILVAGFYLRPLVLSFGRADVIVLIYSTGVIVSLTLYFSMYDVIGPHSMAYAQVIFMGVWAISMIMISYMAWRSRKRGIPSLSQ